MTRNFKAFGLALIALVAIGVMAQAASAHQFFSDQASTVLTGSNEPGTEDVFSITGTGKLEVKCPTTAITGTQLGSPVEKVTVHPKYSNEEKKCKVFPGAIEASVDTGGCNYEFFAETTEAVDFPAEHHAAVSIDCETNAKGEHLHTIKVTAAGCTVEVGSTDPANTVVNQKLHGVTYTNIANDAGAESVTVKSTVKTIVATTVGANCALLGVKAGTYNNGTYNGVAEITGWKDEGTTSGSTTTGFVYKEGVRANITVK